MTKLLLLCFIFSVVSADYYEDFEADLDEIICEKDAECPKHQPICKENHCQVECYVDSDCSTGGKKCLQGKCNQQEAKQQKSRLRNEVVYEEYKEDPDEAIYDEEEYVELSEEYDQVVDKATTKQPEPTSARLHVEEVLDIDVGGNIIIKPDHGSSKVLKPESGSKSETKIETHEHEVQDAKTGSFEYHDKYDEYNYHYYSEEHYDHENWTQTEPQSSKDEHEQVPYENDNELPISSISTPLPETMIGHYKIPSYCDQHTFGSCKYLLAWYKGPGNDQIRFVIQVKNAIETTLGFNQFKTPYFKKSDLIMVTKDLEVKAKKLDGNGIIIDRNNGHLLEADARKLDGHVLFASFVLDIQDFDLDLPGGLYYFADGASQSLPDEYTWFPGKFKLSQRQHFSELQISPQNPKHYGSCNTQPIKFASQTHGFKKYLSCQDGQVLTHTCPQGSIFYFVLQCCVPISKYPCKSNCLLLEFNNKESEVSEEVQEFKTKFVMAKYDKKANAELDYVHDKKEKSANEHNYDYFNY